MIDLCGGQLVIEQDRVEFTGRLVVLRQPDRPDEHADKLIKLFQAFVLDGMSKAVLTIDT